jgi:hypothetical protein
MARVSETYAGAFVSGSELQPLGQRRSAVIHLAEQEAVGQENELKIVLSLVTKDGKAWPRRVVLNKSNALTLARALGDDTATWPSKAIEIWGELVNFKGQMVPGIKIQPAPTLPLAAPLPPPAPSPPQAAARAGGQQWAGGSSDLDDEIPF